MSVEELKNDEKMKKRIKKNEGKEKLKEILALDDDPNEPREQRDRGRSRWRIFK